MAVGDYSRLSKLHPGKYELKQKEAQLFTKIGELDHALTSIKECLRQDPEQKECKKTFREIKKIKKVFEELDLHINKHKYTAVLDKLFRVDNFADEIKMLGSKELMTKCNKYACEAYSHVHYFNIA